MHICCGIFMWWGEGFGVARSGKGGEMWSELAQIEPTLMRVRSESEGVL